MSIFRTKGLMFHNEFMRTVIKCHTIPRTYASISCNYRNLATLNLSRTVTTVCTSRRNIKNRVFHRLRVILRRNKDYLPKQYCPVDLCKRKCSVFPLRYERELYIHTN